MTVRSPAERAAATKWSRAIAHPVLGADRAAVERGTKAEHGAVSRWSSGSGQSVHVQVAVADVAEKDDPGSSPAPRAAPISARTSPAKAGREPSGSVTSSL